MGDNDTLAALVASLVGADGLFLLSDVDGLFDKNPALHPDAQLLQTVETLTPAIRAMATGETGTAGGGTGGMRTKLSAAQIAVSSGIAMWIARGRRPRVLADCLARVPGSGTYFAPLPIRPSAHKRWLAWGSHTPADGTVFVNAFARKAVEEEGRSLLPVGVVGVEGTFAPGDLVNVAGENEAVFARGVAQFSSGDVARLAGVPTSGLASALGLDAPPPRVEIIHRDRLVLLPG